MWNIRDGLPGFEWGAHRDRIESRGRGRGGGKETEKVEDDIDDIPERILDQDEIAQLMMQR